MNPTSNPETEDQNLKPRRGFASMDPSRLKAVSSKGGSAPHRSPVRGFALMDEARRREVSQKGLAARRERMVGMTLETVQQGSAPQPPAALGRTGLKSA